MQPKVKVIYEDEYILLVDKPAGLVSSKLTGAVSLEDILAADFSINLSQGSLVHRLDKDTSGILLVGKTAEAVENLRVQFEDRKVKKQYLALVHGSIREPGLVDVPIERNRKIHDQFVAGELGRLAATEYEPTEKFKVQSSKFKIWFPDLNNIQVKKLEQMKYGEFTLLKCFPLTGRTHQIRVHLKYINHPIVSDFQYAGRKIYKLDTRWCPRQFLHAERIGFYHPKSGQWVEFESPLPKDLSEVLEMLRN